MSNKDHFLKALKNNDGQLNELALGEQLGLDENKTQQIISQLLAEFKIEYVTHRACNYKSLKR